jgi:alpha-mannosidase
VLRNQFHDVLPGTSITPVYEDVANEYARAEELVASVLASVGSMLPRATTPPARAEAVHPQERDGIFIFDNGIVQAHLTPAGAIIDLRVAGGRSVCSQANVLALYDDKPKQWEAWNIDAAYEKRMRHAKPQSSRVENGELIIDFLLGESPASMRVALHAGEPFIRVDVNVDWRERRTLLRVESWLPIQTDRVTFGSPHGSITRGGRQETPAERAKFEVPGQRYAIARDDARSGVALFALDTYGWSARVLPKGGVQIGHSLMRGTTWPDATADIGEHRLSYAFAPFTGVGVGALERAWLRFAHEPRVQLFTCENDAVLVAACKPAHDGDGVIVRVRECDGAHADVALRCAARMTEALFVDGLERPLDEAAAISEESIRLQLAPYELRTLRVRFGHG